MNKKMIVLGVAVAMAVAVGCGATETVEGGEAERMREISSGISNWTNYTVFVDEETGVEYLSTKWGYSGGITPLLNPDGTPKIAEGYETTK